MARLLIFVIFGLVTSFTFVMNARAQTTTSDAGTYGTGNYGGISTTTSPGAACTCADGSPGTLTMTASSDGGTQGYGQTCSCPSNLGTGTNNLSNSTTRDY